MEEIQEAFTRRMLSRVSSRRDRDRHVSLDTSKEDLQRRYNILKAIDDPPTHRESPTGNMEEESFYRNYDLCTKGSDTIESSCNNNNNNKSSIDLYEKIDKKTEKSPSPNGSSFSFYKRPSELTNAEWCREKSSSNLKKTDYSHDFSSINNAIAERKPERLVKVTVRERSIEASPKMIAQLKNLDDKNSAIDTVFESNLTQSSTGSLSAAINELDEQIKKLEMRSPNTFTTKAIVEKPERMYPVLEDIQFETTMGRNISNSQTENYRSASEFVSSEDNTGNNDTNEDQSKRSETYVKDDSDEIMMYHQTPKSERKMPIMESTRKCSHSDSTKIKFPTPSRVESTISSIVPATPESPDYKYNAGEGKLKDIGRKLNDSIPYEVENFLEDALGDELYNTTVTYAASEARDRTNSHFNASELISEDRTPLRKRIMQLLRPPMTEPTPKNSSTLNRSVGFYRSLSQRIKKKFRAPLKTREEVSPPQQPVLTDDLETERFQELLQEISVQQTLMDQAIKALNVCHTMKEFTDSSERIEYERLLLLASLRRKVASEEMKRMTSGEKSNANKQFYDDRGEITIKDIILNLRECLQRESEDGETVEWFVVVVSQGLNVWATRAVGMPINDSRIKLPEAIIIPNLTPSFKILIEVYSLKLRRATYNHEDKYRIRNNHKRSSSCPPFFVSPTKMLKKVERPLSPKIAYNHASKYRNTSFVLSGFVELFLHDLSLSSPWPLMLIPTNSILQGTIDLNLSCRLHLSVSHEGFLNHGDESGGFAIWNRRWCVLKGHTLMFWNYPREQETKDPLTVIELINCVSNKITTVDRTICAKPRTLLIETVRRKCSTDRNSMIVECRSSCTIVRNLLSCDSIDELMEWSTKLNHVIFALKEWNVIGRRTHQPHHQVSDL